jgi:hypothetical protein
MRRVIVESPFAGDVEGNIKYARRCIKDCLLRGEAPFASHLLYTQDGILDDLKPHERELGMTAGFTWSAVADAVVVYTDRGFSRGMRLGVALAEAKGIPVEYRHLGAEPCAKSASGATDSDRQEPVTIDRRPLPHWKNRYPTESDK